MSEKHDSDDGSLAVLSSLSNSSKGSDPEMYAKIDFDKTDALALDVVDQSKLEEDSDRKEALLSSLMASAGTQTYS